MARRPFVAAVHSHIEMPAGLKWAVVVLAIVISVYWFTPPNVGGWWLASDKFKGDSGLSSMMLYLAPHGHGYLVVTPAAAPGATPAKASYSDHITYRVTYGWWHSLWLTIDEDIGVIPSCLRLRVNDGHMTLMADDTLYADLYRDNQLSHTAVVERVEQQ